MILAERNDTMEALLAGHKMRCVFDRCNIVNEQELVTAGQRLEAYVASQVAPAPSGLSPATVPTAPAPAPVA